MYGRLVLVVVVALLGSVELVAAQVSIGAVLGVNRTGISGDNPAKTSYSAKGGLIAGLVLEIPVAKDVKIVFQPGYRQLKAVIGFEVDGEDEPVDSLDVKLDYVSVPVLPVGVSRTPRVY